jgi:hypothetical protein
MNRHLGELTEKLEKEEPAETSKLAQTVLELDFEFPVDYIGFMEECNGGEGFVGDNNYLSIWRIEDLVSWNKLYDVELYAPGYFIFASDGGGTAYAFDKIGGCIVSFQLTGMLISDTPLILGSDFISFLEYLSKH